MPPPCFQRPWRSISWVGAPFWAMRLAMPTRPLWPLKNSQSVNPAALAITFTRRAICDSDNPNTFTSPPTPTGRRASKAPLAAGVMATTAPWASASVLERITVTRPLPSSQRRRLGPAESGVGQRGHQGHVESPPLLGLLRGFEAAAAPAGLDGGEADGGKGVGDEGAGLALGFRESAAAVSFQRGAHARVPAGGFLLRPLVCLGNSAGGMAQSLRHCGGLRPYKVPLNAFGRVCVPLRGF